MGYKSDECGHDRGGHMQASRQPTPDGSQPDRGEHHEKNLGSRPERGAGGCPAWHANSQRTGPQNGRPKKSSIQRTAPETANFAGEFDSARLEEAQPKSDQADQNQQRENGEAAVIQQLSANQPLQHTWRAPKESDFHAWSGGVALISRDRATGAQLEGGKQQGQPRRSTERVAGAAAAGCRRRESVASRQIDSAPI